MQPGDLSPEQLARRDFDAVLAKHRPHIEAAVRAAVPELFAAPALPPVPDVEALVTELQTLVAGVRRENELAVGVFMCAASMEKAAAALQSQAAECARLREALERIRKEARDYCTLVESDGGYPGGGYYDTLRDIQRHVRQALSQEPTP